MGRSNGSGRVSILVNSGAQSRQQTSIRIQDLHGAAPSITSEHRLSLNYLTVRRPSLRDVEATRHGGRAVQNQ